jgi:hypothetical protein
MINDTYVVQFKFSSEYVTYDAYFSDFSKTEILHKGLRGADNTVSCTMVPTIELANLLRTIPASGVSVRITKNNNPWFTGFIRKNFTLRRATALKPISLEIVSPSFYLKRKIQFNISFIGYQVCNPLNQEKSIAHQLLIAAGIDSTMINLPEIPFTIPAYCIDEDTTTWYNALESLFFQYVKIIDFDANGTAIARDMFPASSIIEKYFTTGRTGNIIGEISVEATEEEYAGAEIEWNEAATDHNATVFEDVTGATNAADAMIPLEALSYYGVEDEDTEMYAEYSLSNKSLIYAYNCISDFQFDSGINLLAFTPSNKRALLSIYNSNSTITKYITRLKITGSAVYIKSKNKSKVHNSETPYTEFFTFTADSIYEKTAADTLANTLANYYKYSDNEISFYSTDEVAIGTICEIKDSEIGSVVARIIQKKETGRDRSFYYLAEATGEYVGATPSGNKTITSPALLYGPAGPAGPQGEQGDPGPAGDPGIITITSSTTPAGTYNGQPGVLNGVLYFWSMDDMAWIPQDAEYPTEDPIIWFAMSDVIDFSDGSKLLIDNSGCGVHSTEILNVTFE